VPLRAPDFFLQPELSAVHSESCMKYFSKTLLITLLLTSLRNEAADVPIDKSEILAQRGKGVVTQQMFTARADKIPADVREPTLRSGNRLRDVINSLLLRAQLAADAREAGFDLEQIVIDRMQLAAQNELAEAWLEHYVNIQPEADYEQLARENYLLRQEKMYSTPRIDVSHILVSTKERSNEDAKELADDIYQQLLANPDSFGELVVKFSEDPSASSNKGSFTGVKKGDMVKPFEDAAFALKDGEISEPVETDFGYHIIRLDAHIAPVELDFEDLKDNLMRAERKKHDERIKRDYLESLTSLEVHMTEEQLGEMVSRQFGEKSVDAKATGDDSE